jgi:hypothetical protein
MLSQTTYRVMCTLITGSIAVGYVAPLASLIGWAV